MPSKTRVKNAVALPKSHRELLDQIVQGPMIAETIQDASLAFKKA